MIQAWLQRRKERKMWKMAHRVKLFVRALDEATTLHAANLATPSILTPITNMFVIDMAKELADLAKDNDLDIERLTRIAKERCMPALEGT